MSPSPCRSTLPGRFNTELWSRNRAQGVAPFSEASGAVRPAATYHKPPAKLLYYRASSAVCARTGAELSSRHPCLLFKKALS